MLLNLTVGSILLRQNVQILESKYNPPSNLTVLLEAFASKGYHVKVNADKIFVHPSEKFRAKGRDQVVCQIVISEQKPNAVDEINCIRYQGDLGLSEAELKEEEEQEEQEEQERLDKLIPEGYVDKSALISVSIYLDAPNYNLLIKNIQNSLPPDTINLELGTDMFDENLPMESESSLGLDMGQVWTIKEQPEDRIIPIGNVCINYQAVAPEIDEETSHPKVPQSNSLLTELKGFRKYVEGNYDFIKQSLRPLPWIVMFLLVVWAISEFFKDG
tara:strand:- start:125 stop:943 length:819 start_codon:yes stop_codon:yes gene_type:complete